MLRKVLSKKPALLALVLALTMVLGNVAYAAEATGSEEGSSVAETVEGAAEVTVEEPDAEEDTLESEAEADGEEEDQSSGAEILSRDEGSVLADTMPDVLADALEADGTGVLSTRLQVTATLNAKQSNGIYEVTAGDRHTLVITVTNTGDTEMNNILVLNTWFNQSFNANSDILCFGSFQGNARVTLYDYVYADGSTTTGGFALIAQLAPGESIDLYVDGLIPSAMVGEAAILIAAHEIGEISEEAEIEMDISEMSEPVILYVKVGNQKQITNPGNNNNAGDKNIKQTSSEKSAAVKTGDTSNAVLYILMMAAVIAAVTVVVVIRRKKDR